MEIIASPDVGHEELAAIKKGEEMLAIREMSSQSLSQDSFDGNSEEERDRFQLLTWMSPTGILRSALLL